MAVNTGIIHSVADTVANHAEKPAVGITLIAAGVAPMTIFPPWFNSSFIGAIYFSLLIPPAAYHLYSFFKKIFCPGFVKVCKWIRKVLNIEEA